MKHIGIAATAFVAAVAALSTFASPAEALDAGAAAAAALPAPSALAAKADAGAGAGHPGPLPAGAQAAPLPEGHPNLAGGTGSTGANAATSTRADGESDDGEDESGMPRGPAAADANANPAAGTVDANGIFRAPPDAEQEDPALPPGTIVVRILDAMGMPVPHAPITLGILKNSVAKGESREKVVREADASGTFVFSGLTVGSGIAYRVTSPRGDGTFAAMPFNLPAARGMRVGLHVYDVNGDIQAARIVFQAALYVEVKDDRVQFEELFAVFNFGKVAWVPPADLLIPLPPEYTAFSAQQEMSDTGAEAVAGKGIKLHGTFGPGRHDVTFRWQLPYDGASELALDVGLPPHVATSRVVAAAAPGMTLSVDGFPAAQSAPEGSGQRVLQTERQVQPNDAQLRTIHVRLKDLPTAGPARFVATGIAGMGVLAGLAFAFGRAGAGSGASKKPRRRERALLLAELEDLERAHATGEIGPKTYERARRELIDALARTLGEA